MSLNTKEYLPCLMTQSVHILKLQLVYSLRLSFRLTVFTSITNRTPLIVQNSCSAGSTMKLSLNTVSQLPAKYLSYRRISSTISLPITKFLMAKSPSSLRLVAHTIHTPLITSLHLLRSYVIPGIKEQVSQRVPLMHLA